MQQPPAYQYPPQQPATVVYPPQQPGTNVVITQPQQSTGYVIQNAPQEEGCCSGVSQKFNVTGGRATGILQLIIAVLCIILGGAAYAFPDAYYYNGYGIWSGLLFFMTAGILGICSYNQSTSVITAYLVMSILSCFEAFSLLVYEGVYAGIYAISQTCNYSCSYSSYDCNYVCSSGGSEGAVAVHSILAVLAVIEFIVSIVGAAICCGGLRCCCASPTPTATTTTTSTTYTNQVGYVVQPGQPGIPGQQPPPMQQQQAYVPDKV